MAKLIVLYASEMYHLSLKYLDYGMRVHSHFKIFPGLSTDPDVQWFLGVW